MYRIVLQTFSTITKIKIIKNNVKFFSTGLQPFRAHKISIPVWLPNDLYLLALSNTEKACLASYYSQIPTIIKIKIIESMLYFLARALGTLGPTKLVLFVYFFHSK
jgi:hypothetical protein